MVWCVGLEEVRQRAQSMLRIVAVRGPKAPQPRRGWVNGMVRDMCAPCRGRCPHRPACRTIEHRTLGRRPARRTIEHRGLGCRSPVRICPHASVNGNRYRRDDVGIVPYEHERTAHVVRRAGPVCPAAGMHRKPPYGPKCSDCVGRGLAPAVGTDSPGHAGHRHPHRTAAHIGAALQTRTDCPCGS